MDKKEYIDYRDIAIEINDKIRNFLASFKIGSTLSFDVLVDLAKRTECTNCNGVFFSQSLYDSHKESCLDYDEDHSIINFQEKKID